MHYGDGVKSLDKAFRPKPDRTIRAERRLLHPAEREEIKQRFAIYAKQVKEQGQITWLPRRGSGLSASAEMNDSAECAAESADVEGRTCPS